MSGPDQIDAPVSAHDRLAAIEDRLDRIETMLGEAHRAIMPVLENPGRLLAKIMGGGK